jgi:hypothetical protein
MTIISAYQDAGSYRGAAAICGTTPKTVKRVIQRAQTGGVRPEPKPRVRNYEVVVDLVAERVKKSAGRISAKRLLPAARTAGYVGSDRNFRRMVAQAKKDWRVEHHRGRRPAVWSPGEHLVIDWGSQGGVHVFCAVLAWSRWRFVRFAADEKCRFSAQLASSHATCRTRGEFSSDVARTRPFPALDCTSRARRHVRLLPAESCPSENSPRHMREDQQ